MFSFFELSLFIKLINSELLLGNPWMLALMQENWLKFSSDNVLTISPSYRGHQSSSLNDYLDIGHPIPPVLKEYK